MFSFLQILKKKDLFWHHPGIGVTENVLFSLPSKRKMFRSGLVSVGKRNEKYLYRPQHTHTPETAFFFFKQQQ